MNNIKDEQNLKRGLKNRHVQLIALGGAIGTGLFLGSAGAISLTGPSVILSYLVGGLIAFIIMRQLGEMMTEEPVAGSFSNLAYKYWGDFPGFLSGWNYWVLYILVGMSELTALGVYVNYWYPHIPLWVTTLFFFVLVNFINILSVNIYGEMEFWFAIIKVIAIIGMILLGSVILIQGAPAVDGGVVPSLSNLWSGGDIFPNGWKFFFMSIAIVVFSFGGLELVGIAAAETENPKVTIPKAINQILFRILIFYVGALVILLSLYKWDQLAANVAANVDWSKSMDASPFVSIFSKMGIDSAATILNLVVLTAALSVYNSCVFSNSRMLYGLALQGNAPKFLTKTNSKGVPLNSIFISSSVTAIGVLINYFYPEEALGFLMSLVSGALVINWAMISLTHLNFKKAMKNKHIKTLFPAIGYPFLNYFCILFTLLVLTALWNLGDKEKFSVKLIPIWIILVAIGYLIKKYFSKQATN